MLNLQCIRLFKFQLKISRFIGDVPFYWKSERNLPGILCHQTPNIFSKWNLISLMVTLWCSFLSARFCYLAFWKRNLSTEVMLQFVIWLLFHMAVLLVWLQLLVKRGEICLAVNGIVSLWFKKFRTKNTKLHQILLVWVIGFPFAPFCIASLFWFDPCAPQFLYSIMHSHCSSEISFDQESGRLAKIFYFFLETILISQISAFGPMLVFLMIIPLSCFNGCFSEIHRRCSNLYSMRQNSHASFPLLKETILYREMQYLMKVFSEIFQEYLLPMVISSHSICTIASMFDLIKRMNSGEKGEPVGYIIYITLLAISVGFEAILLEFASKPIVRSKQVKGQWRSMQYTQKNEWLEKFEMSCPILKIYTRPSLPIERDKLAVFLRFCLQRTVFIVVYNR